MKAHPPYSLIKELYNTLPRGTPLDMPTLHKIGISNQRAAGYARNGWLTRVGRGVYVFPGESLSLQAALGYLSTQIDGLHVGGYSALTRKSTPLVLWGEARVALPRWFSERFCVRYTSARLFDWDTSSLPEIALTEAGQSLGGIKCSTPERAVLEMLYEVDGKQPLEQAYCAFSQVQGMYPEVVGRLLQCCTSVKAKRLFLKWGRECGQFNVDAVLNQYSIPKGSPSRWVTRLKDGSTLSLKPYG